VVDGGFGRAWQLRQQALFLLLLAIVYFSNNFLLARRSSSHAHGLITGSTDYVLCEKPWPVAAL
jgi:hypothetical protein